MRARQQGVYNLNGDDRMAKGYVLQAVRYNTMRGEDIINYCCANSYIPRAYLVATLEAIAECFSNYLLNGHSVELPWLGIFSLAVSSRAVADAGETGLGQLEKISLRYRPCREIREQLKRVSMEFDGAYDIAGEVAVATDGEGNVTRKRKVYKRVSSGTATDMPPTEWESDISMLAPTAHEPPETEGPPLNGYGGWLVE